MEVIKYQPFVESGIGATRIKLVRNAKDITDGVYFRPDMCHQVFGENETVFGYTNLTIDIYYHAATFQCFVDSDYDCKLDYDPATNLTSEDYMEKLNPWLPANYFVERQPFEDTLNTTLPPFGSLIRSFTKSNASGNTSEYEVYTCNNKEPGYADFHQRLETLIVWFIDAANYIDISDEKWKFYILYEKVQVDNQHVHYPVGYSTVYEYFLYPDSRRYRISQFIVFPPFQRMGLGTELLRAVYEDLWTLPNIHDITVEDPSEGFQNMRDFVDVKLCRSLPSYAPDLLKTNFTKDMANEGRSIYKLNEKQCRRVYEILYLYNINLSDTNALESYRLIVKSRLNTPYKTQQTKRFAKLLKDSTSVQSDHQAKTLDKSFDSLITQYLRVIQRLRVDDADTAQLNIN